MGNEKSKKSSSKQAEVSNGKIMNDTKKIVLLHKSSDEQLKVVRNFRDALISTANGSVRVTELINISGQKPFSKDVPWLEELNNVILICLTPEAISELEKVIRDQGFVDDNGHLHGKVFTVSFGNNLTSKWSSNGIARGLLDARDFTFGFEQTDMLKPKDFEKAEKMTSLVAAIKGTN